MATIVRMPEILAGSLEAAIQTWLVAEGDTIAVGQPLAEIETDKAVAEFQSDAGGTVSRILASEGDNVAVGVPILVLTAAGEDAAAVDAALAAEGFAPTAVETPTAPSEPTPTPDATPSPAPAAADFAASAVIAPATTDQADGRRLFASPLVRRLAQQHRVDIAAIDGTGPNGRIVRRDLERFLAQAESPSAAAEAQAAADPMAATPAVATPAGIDAAGYQDIPLDRMRKTIARRLTESKSTVPHFYLVAHCRVDALLALRAQVNAGAPRKISVNDFVVKAAAGAFTDVPEANAVWNGDSIRRFSSVDISIAVATDGGLVTPIVRSVEKTSLGQVSEQIADLASRGKEGRLKQQEIEGGSFSISNLGMYGTSEFSAILNPPQSGILAVGAASKRPIVGDDGELAVGQVMTVTLSADHRVLDGALAATWLAAFQRRIENPLTILI
jgi:pyruvate dehydrogenase E2 component (dihydrolipoamide acetyltransferase)